MKSHVPTWNHFPRHEWLFPERFGRLKRTFFKLFSCRGGAILHFFRELTASPRHVFALFSHNSYHSARFLATFLMEFCFFWNELVTKKPFPASFCDRGTRLCAVFSGIYGGLVCEVAMFLLKITLKRALCLFLKTLCAGFVFKNTLEQDWACV